MSGAAFEMAVFDSTADEVVRLMKEIERLRSIKINTVFAVLIETDQGVRGLHSIFSREYDADRAAKDLIGTETPSGKIVAAVYEPHRVDDWLVRPA